LPAPAGSPAPNLERLKQRLLEQELRNVRDPRLGDWLRRAAEEAASLAWATAFPLLVLPVLLTEKAAEARRHHEHQRQVSAHSEELLWFTGLAPAQGRAFTVAMGSACPYVHAFPVAR
jgi:hypothetical protein